MRSAAVCGGADPSAASCLETHRRASFEARAGARALQDEAAAMLLSMRPNGMCSPVPQQVQSAGRSGMLSFVQDGESRAHCECEGDGQEDAGDAEQNSTR
jgi:hypothetical protein